MKKCLMHVFMASLWLVGCTQDDGWLGITGASEDVDDVEIVLPEKVDDYGKAVAMEVSGTVERLVKMNADYSDADGSVEFKERFLKDFYTANPTIRKKRTIGEAMPQIGMTTEEFVERYRTLTEVQIKFIHRIIDECENSQSDYELLKKLSHLKDVIYTDVPEIEQERLLNVISVLFYSVKELDHLEAQGMTLTPQKTSLNIPRLRRSGETAKDEHNKDDEKDENEDGSNGNGDNGNGSGSVGGGGTTGGGSTSGGGSGSSVSSNCRKFLTAVWVIAVGEPTPAGEIVASVITVWVAGELLYEVITCRKSYSAYCTEQYEKCQNDKKSPWSKPNSGGTWGTSMCLDCMRKCEIRGFWVCPV